MSNRTSGNLQLAKAALSQSESSAPVSAEYDANMEAIDSAISSGGGASPIQTATVTLTDAQIKTLSANGFTLVADPGVNKVIVPIAANFHLKGIVPYTYSGDGTDYLQVFSPDGQSYDICQLLLFTFVADKLFSVPALVINGTPLVGQATTPPYGGPLELGTNTGTELAGGDPANTLTVTAYYTVVTLS